MRDHLILRVVAKLLIPFILLYALYIQMHGEYSPGGGFQAGVIFASAFILYCLVFGLRKTLKVISINELRILSAIGVLIYLGTGIVTMIMGGNFLDYSYLLANDVYGQRLGIMAVELGVGVTVFSVMLLIFLVFVQRNN